MTAAPHMAEALTKAAFELAAQVLDDHGDSAATEALGQRLCCSGQDCGCRGATVGEYLQHLIRSMTFSDLPADVITATANQAVRFGMEARDRAEIALSLAIESQTEGEWQPSTRQAHELFEAVLASLPAPDEKDAEIARLREALCKRMERLKRALADKPYASKVTLNRATVEAMLAAMDGKQVVTLSDAARLIQRQRYLAVGDALSAADDLRGEDAVTAFLNALSSVDDITASGAL